MKKVVFNGGCRGNTTGVSKLAEGRSVDELISLLEGIQCRGGTSCPDQFAKALKEKYIPELVIYGNKENDFGGNVLINMLKSVDRYPFEGIIAASRSIAIKVQDVLNAMKLEMPLILLKDGKRGDKISSITFPDNIAA